MSKLLFSISLLMICVQFASSQSSDSIIIDTILTNSEIRFKDSIDELNKHNNMLISSRNAYNDGLILLEELDMEGAINSFTNAITIDSTFSDAYFYRAKCYDDVNYELAVSDYKTAYELDSSDLDPLYCLAKIYSDKTIAIKTYELIISKAPKEAKAYYEKGVICYLAGDIDEAIISFTASISINKEARSLNDRGSCYRKLENYELAVTDYLTAIALNSDLAFIYNNLASAYRKQGNSEKALSYYSIAISKDTTYSIAFNNRGSLYLELNNFEDAKNDIDKAILIDNNYAPAYNNRGVISHKNKKYTDALADFDKAIKLNNNYAKAYLNRGITRQMTRDEDGACSDWKKAKELGVNLANKYLANDCY